MTTDTWTQEGRIQLSDAAIDAPVFQGIALNLSEFNGKAAVIDQINQTISTACSLAGFPIMTSHDFRRGAVRDLAKIDSQRFVLATGASRAVAGHGTMLLIHAIRVGAVASGAWDTAYLSQHHSQSSSLRTASLRYSEFQSSSLSETATAIIVSSQIALSYSVASMSDSDVDFLMPYAVGSKAKQMMREDTDMAARVKRATQVN